MSRKFLRCEEKYEPIKKQEKLSKQRHIPLNWPCEHYENTYPELFTAEIAENAEIK